MNVAELRKVINDTTLDPHAEVWTVMEHVAEKVLSARKDPDDGSLMIFAQE